MGLFDKLKKSDKKDKETQEKMAEVSVPEKDSTEREEAKTVLPQGKDADAYRTVLSPYVTEKSTLLNKFNQYAFRVSRDSNKSDIKRAIESLYKVSVLDVRTINLPSKVIRIGGQEGLKSGLKKAIVTLKDGDSIQLT